jgi:hypothetical protein
VEEDVDALEKLEGIHEAAPPLPAFAAAGAAGFSFLRTTAEIILTMKNTHTAMTAVMP